MAKPGIDSPERLTVCGLPKALSLMVSVPVRVPVAVGVKVTVIEHTPPAARLLPQLLDWEKSPLTVTPEMFNVRGTGFNSFTVCVGLVVLRFWLAKARAVVDNCASGPSPVPVRVTVVGPPAALSEIVSTPVRVPAAVGVKVTFMAQEAVVARLLPQLFVALKSPLALIPPMVRATTPVLDRVTD